MKLFLLTSLTMIAFAANSVLNRLALAEGEIGPGDFALIRVLSGAVMLCVLASFRPHSPQKSKTHISLRQSALSGGMLALYLLGFSYAYQSLETGMGALILFGGVQLTMFVGAILANDRISRQRWFGSLTAFVGLIWLLLPGTNAPPLTGAALMGLAAMGWGLYSLFGRKMPAPLPGARNSFLAATPIVLIVTLLVGFNGVDQQAATKTGIMLAILSGAVTSGLGYALWYALLPKLDMVTAALVQLTVPVIALVGGVLFLDEPVTWRFITAASLILFGIFVAVRSNNRS